MANVDRDYPFSWYRCVVSLVSYALLLSDVLRTGPAIHQIPKDFSLLEPDCAMSFGPEGYAVNHLTRENATLQETSPFWPYKYDTTSAGIRAIAQHLRANGWSSCMLYQERCDETQGLSLLMVFEMIDSLVDAIQSSEPQQRSISLRIKSLFRDSLHHYVMPWFFEYKVKRTIQGTYYAWDRTEMTHSMICNPTKMQRPFWCSQLWASRLEGSCSPTQRDCRIARTIRMQMLDRVRMLQQLYPQAIIDSVMIDSMEDYTEGGMTYQGHQWADVVLLSRARSCLNTICTTVAVDDFRFETALLLMNVSDWFSIVAILRVMGQAYTWLRMLLLFWICHITRRDSSRQYRQSSRFAQCRIVIRTVFLVPSQVVVYGSLLPISLYYVAHLIDSPASYILAYVKFDSLLGRITWNFLDIAHYCAVSMRAVWVLSFYCHLVQGAWMRCSWSATYGVPGISEFVITLIASLTLFAQYRMLLLRNSAILEIFEVVPSARMHQLRSYPRGDSQSALFKTLFGQIVDWKCLLQATILVAGLYLLLRWLNRMTPAGFPFQVSMILWTAIPYSTGYLWSRNRLVVSWFGAIVTTPWTLSEKSSHILLREDQVQTLIKVAVPHSTQIQSQESSPNGRMESRKAVPRSRTSLSLQVQREMQSPSMRSRGTESVLYLMNFVAMTDPITFLRLRFFSGHQVAMYKSNVTQQRLLLPYELRVLDAGIGIDWKEWQFVAVANTKDLQWDDLFRCG